MRLLYELFWATGTAILLLFLVPIVLSVLSDVCCGMDGFRDKGYKPIIDSSSVDIVDKRARKCLDKEGKFDGRMKVKCSKTKKKKVKFSDETATIAEFLVKEETPIVAKDKGISSQSVEFVDEKGDLFNILYVDFVGSGKIEGRNMDVVDLPDDGNLFQDVLVKELERNKELEVDGGVKGLIEEVKEWGCSKTGSFDKGIYKGNESDKMVVEERTENVGVDRVDAKSGTSGVYIFGCVGKNDVGLTGSKFIGEGKRDDELKSKVHQIGVDLVSEIMSIDRTEPEKIEALKETERREKSEHRKVYEVAGELAVVNEAVYDQKKEAVIVGSQEIEERKSREHCNFGVDMAWVNNVVDKMVSECFAEDERSGCKNRTDDEDGQGLTSDKIIDDQRKDICTIVRSDGTLGNVDERAEIGVNNDKDGVLSDEEEWEGIEKSELEKDFSRATNFVERGDKEGRLVKLWSGVMKRLFGLQKVAMEGSCCRRQSMALQLPAWRNWNGWQKLENMSPEDAMEQCITLLSDNIPGWMEDCSGVESGGIPNYKMNPGKLGAESSEKAMI